MWSLVLLSVSGPAHASSCSDEATVVSDVLTLKTGRDRRLRGDRIWRVKVDDPRGCEGKIPLPPGMDDASTSEGDIIDGTLRVTNPGEYTVTLPITLPLTGGSGRFQGAPGLTTAEASLRIEGPATQSLSIWSESGALEITGKRTRSVSLSFPSDVASYSAAWSTWSHWLDVDTSLEAYLRSRVAPRWALPRSWQANMTKEAPYTLIDRVLEAIEPTGETGDWLTSRSARDVIRAKKGSATERGLAVLSLLRAAGHDARLAGFSPTPPDGPSAFPDLTPFETPMIALRRSDQLPLLLNLTDGSIVTEHPREGALWISGEVPRVFDPSDAPLGTVEISIRQRLEATGEARITATLTAAGLAGDTIRQRFTDLAPKARKALFQQMVAQNRPTAQVIAAGTANLTDSGVPVRITLEMMDSAALSPLAGGLAGEVQPVIAPQLAEWLGADHRTREVLSIDLPKGLDRLGGYGRGHGVATDGEVAASLYWRTLESKKPTLITTTSWVDGVDSKPVFQSTRPRMPLVLLQGTVKTVSKALRKAKHPSHHLLSALYAWEQSEPVIAEKLFAKAIKRHGISLVATELGRYAPTGRIEPWEYLIAMSSLTERLEVLEAANRRGDRQRVLDLSREIMASPHGPTAATAATYFIETQGRKPLEHEKRPWLPPIPTLAKAAGLTDAAREPYADALLTAGRAEDAAPVVASLPPGPLADAMKLELRALGGPPADEIRRALRAVRPASDTLVLESLARTAALVDAHDLEWRYLHAAAARRGNQTVAWERATRAALSNGDLRAAAWDAITASNIARKRNRIVHGAAHVLAALVGDEANSQRASSRAGFIVIDEWTTGFDAVTRTVPDDQRMAWFRAQDDGVASRPEALEERLMLHQAAVALDGVARDAAFLHRTHKKPDAVIPFFAASRAQYWSSAASAILTRNWRRPAVRSARMEFRLISGNGDPLQDAYALARTNDRAATLLRTVREADALAAEVDGWPTELTDPETSAPEGFVSNRVLGSASGVVAYSHRGRDAAFIRYSATTELPPPLANLWFPGAVERVRDGVEHLRLIGGPFDLWCARIVRDGETLMGVGLTEADAVFALRQGDR